MRFISKPLPAVWPGGKRTPAEERTWGGFRAGWEDTLELLGYELGRLDAVEPVIWMAGYQPHEIRLDGKPRAGARPVDPAVVYRFESRHGPLQFGCDRYASHERNVRGIALGLQALRAVDRYGVTQGGEQYRGWTSLPAVGETGMTTHDAETFIRTHANGDGVDQDLRTALRVAAKKLNPQLPNAEPVLWRELMRAKEALGL